VKDIVAYCSTRMPSNSFILGRYLREEVKKIMQTKTIAMPLLIAIATIVTIWIGIGTETQLTSN
jgi:hypothetical protein